MRQYVRSGLIASIVAGLASVSGAQVPAVGKAGAPAGPATKAATPPRPANFDQVLATVNGEPITREELYRLFSNAGVGSENEQEAYQIGMEQLVNNKLIGQYLKKQKSLDIPEKEIDAEFAEAEKKLKQDGQDIFVALASHGIAVPTFRDQIRSTLRWKKYLDAVSTDEALKKFVANNKDEFNQTLVRASHIVLIVPPETSPADKEKAKQKLAGIKKEIDSGKISFADAANKYSEDDGNKSSPSGGDMGFFPRKALAPQFTDAAFSIKKGLVSEIVETPFGFHLILVTDRKEGTPIDFEAKKLFIRSEYAADLTEKIVLNERKTAKIEIKPLPADLFPKAPPALPSSAAPGEPGKATASPTTKGAAPK